MRVNHAYNSVYKSIYTPNLFDSLNLKRETPQYPIKQSQSQSTSRFLKHITPNPLKIYPIDLRKDPIVPAVSRITRIEDPSLGFIITRHVNSGSSNLYWIECIHQIRKFYPQSKIVIIDDNSDPQFLKCEGVDLENCHIIDSEFKKRGEILPYYYLHKYKFFEKAVIIHDAVFIQAPIDFSNVENIEFLWTFEGNYVENFFIERTMLSRLKNSEELLDLHTNRKNWVGCFGVMSVVTYDFVKLLNDKYKIFNIMALIDSRMKRCCLERVFGIICHHALMSTNNTNQPITVFGDINDNIPHNKYSFSEYLRDKNHNKIPITRPFVKVFSGR
jgi:hypothetical protein